MTRRPLLTYSRAMYAFLHIVSSQIHPQVCVCECVSPVVRIKRENSYCPGSIISGIGERLNNEVETLCKRGPLPLASRDIYVFFLYPRSSILYIFFHSLEDSRRERRGLRESPRTTYGTVPLVSNKLEGSENLFSRENVP